MKYCYFIFILFLSLFYQAQRHTSRWYGMDEGLPQNSIKDITKDRYGFIWLSTDGGIVRYDGENFLLYNDFKLNYLSFKEFLNDGKGNIVSCNNDDKNCVLIADRSVNLIPEKKIAKTYFVKDDKQYKRFYKNTLISKFFPDIDYYYLKTASGMYFFDDDKIEYKDKNNLIKTVIPNFHYNNLRNVFEQNNVVYIADSSKRRTLILKNGEVSYDNRPSLYNDPQSKIYWHQETAQVFIINKGNIYKSKIVNGEPTLSLLMQYKNIEKQLLYCIFYDEESNKLYLGNVVKGLNIIDLSKFYVSLKNIPFTGEVAYEALPFSANSVITKDGIEFYKDRTNRIYSEELKYDQRFLQYDHSKNLLYLEFFKIQRRFRNSQFQKKDSISFPGKYVKGLFKTDRHYMVTMTNHTFDMYYLYVFPDDQFKKAQNIFSFKGYANFVKDVNDDLIYVGTNDGIYLISLSKNKVIKHIAKNLPVKEIQRTKDGNFWFTTYNKGFYMLKNDKAIKMPDDKGGYISDAHHILEDDKGIFWISSNNGLFKIPKKALIKYAQNKNNKVVYYRYTKENGFLNNEFNGSSNPGGNILENGEFVFPSMEGFVFFKPSDVKTYYPKSNQVYIERAKVGKKTFHFQDTLRLQSDYKNAEIFLDIPYYHNLENIYLESKLENKGNSRWEEVNNRIYKLSDINPGNYTLIIRFLVSENGDFAYKKIHLEIIPFFYETLWFKILVTVLGVLLIVVVIQMRTNFLLITNKNLKQNLDNKDEELKKAGETIEVTKSKLKNESEYQHKIVKSISHDITTPVRFIVSISKKLGEVEDPEVQKQYFETIYQTSEQLFKFTLGLKEYTELFKENNTFDEEYSLFDAIEEKKLLFERIAADNHTVIINDCSVSLETKINKNILSAILHNLIDNSVKNTTNGKISIKSVSNNDEVEIAIFDDGKGMSKDQIVYYNQVFESIVTEDFIFKSYGLGLHMVIQLVKKINAKIIFYENFPKGTVVKLSLKTNANE